MRKILFSILLLTAFLVPNKAHATACTVPYGNELTGAFIYAAHWNANLSSLLSCLNNQLLDGTTNIAIGGIQTSNIANLAVTDAKIAGITTAGKVNGSAITGLGNLPAGGGTIPTVNLGSGSASSSTVLLGNQTWGTQFPGPVLAVRSTTSQNINSGTWTQVTFNTTDKDSGSYWASNTYTPLVAGWYLVTFTDTFTNVSAATEYEAAIYKTGTLYAAQSVNAFASNAFGGTSVSAIVQLNGSTDTISFYAYAANDNSTIGSLLSGSNGTSATIVRVL